MSDRLQRRVAGWHDIRLDGMSDLLLRCSGASVLDVGCNRGMVALEFYANGASLVHGCDIYAEGIATANHVFVDRRNVEAKFEVVDLSAGAISLQAFGNQRYDIIVVLATIHKLRRVMQREMLYDLIRELGERTIKYLGWRATSEKFQENEEEMAMMDGALAEAGLRRVHTSYISQELGVAAIWMRK